MPLDTIEVASVAPAEAAHPWNSLEQATELPNGLTDGQSIELVDTAGRFLGCGVFDRNDTAAVWRRYTQAEGVEFDEAYVGVALIEAIERRGEEGCQRLVGSDADYLPGLVVELFNDVVRMQCETMAVKRHVDFIAEVLKESLDPLEIVVDAGEGPNTVSGQGLKGRWIEVDELFYRIDLLNTDKPCFYLDQREQHALVGSLCEGRTVLDAFSHSGAFAIQTMRAGAERAVAVDKVESYTKGIGAHAQRNECPVEVVAGDVSAYLNSAIAGQFDAIIYDPSADTFSSVGESAALHQRAFTLLPSGGLLATYCRDSRIAIEGFERLVADAAARAGREARVFARTSQPFDFPMLLNFPESQVVRGLILQVE